MSVPGTPLEAVRAEGPWAHRFVHAHGMKFHVVVAGDEPERPTVILLHDFPLHWWSWRKQIVELEQSGYRVVALDFPGFGGTDFQPGSVELEELAQDVIAVAKATGTPEYTVIGSGMGGAVAWFLAHQGPTGLQSAVSICSPHPLGRKGRRAQRTSAGSLREGSRGVQLGKSKRLQDGSMVDRALTGWCAPASIPHMRELVPSYAQALRRKVAADSALETQKAVRHPSSKAKKQMENPVRVPFWSVIGGSDRKVRVKSYARDSHFAKSPVTHIELADSGHFPSEETPGELSTLIRQHLVSVYGE